MFTTAVIGLREFLEAFLIVGVFFGISRKLKLKKELEIGLAAGIGVLISFLLASLTYFFGDHARSILTEERADLLESYLLIFSGLFIAYVIFSLHNFLHKNRGQTLILAHKKLQQNVFDISLFLTIVFLVAREGFEIALFTASISLFADFMQNMIGLAIGLLCATALGVATFFAYIKFSVGKIFKYTEYLIILLGASLIQHGFTKLLEYFNINISTILSFRLTFLPDEESVAGHLIKSLTGIDREFSFMRLSIMVVYIGSMYLLFMKKKKRFVTR